MADKSRGGVVESDIQVSSGRSAAPQLKQLDARGTPTLDLDRAWRFGGELWLLTQAGKPVGMLERTAGRIALRTVSEEWRGGLRRRVKRLAWHLHFARAEGGEPALQYNPSTLLPGGHLAVSGGRRYRLRCPLLRADWKLAAVPRGEIGRIAPSRRDSTMRVALSRKAAGEPLLPLVILAAGVAIIIHGEQPSGGSGGVW